MANVATAVGRASLVERALAWLIFLHYLVYEVVYFFYPSVYPTLGLLSNTWKLAMPVGLALVAGLPNLNLLRRERAVLSALLLFGLFWWWALVTSFGTPASLLEWAKLFPRLAFFFAVALLFCRNPRVCVATAKLMVAWALLSVAQYVVLNLVGPLAASSFYAWGGQRAGPGGVLGNVTSMMFIPGLGSPVVRLAGFWNEPSNACASLFACFFLARWIAAVTGDPRWRRAGLICLMGGFASLSNAGYVALAMAVLFGAVVRMRLETAVVRRLAVVGFAVAMVVLAVLGRLYIAEHYGDNPYLRAITGLRLNPDEYLDGGLNMALGGRITLMVDAFEMLRQHPFGAGLLGVDADQSQISASAPVGWLLMTGPIGLLLILSRDAWVWRAFARDGSAEPAVRFAGQAFVVVAVQHVAYGSWMNPLYFILSAMVLATASWRRRGILPAAAGNRQR